MSGGDGGEHRLRVIRENGYTFPVEGSAALRGENRAETGGTEAESWGDRDRECAARGRAMV